MTSVAKCDGRGSTAQRELLRVSTGQRDTGRGHSRLRFSMAPRFLRVWQRRGAEIRTDASAPEMTGLPLNGMCWLDSPVRRCHSSQVAHHSNPAKSTGILAAAQEPSVITIPSSPKILSAFRRKNRRQDSPGLILGGGGPCWRTSWPRNRAAGNNQASLCLTRTLPPRLGNQLLFRRTHTALTGAIGVDSKTGAAIHRPVAPEESE